MQILRISTLLVSVEATDDIFSAERANDRFMYSIEYQRHTICVFCTISTSQSYLAHLSDNKYYTHTSLFLDIPSILIANIKMIDPE